MVTPWLDKEITEVQLRTCFDWQRHQQEASGARAGLHTVPGREDFRRFLSRHALRRRSPSLLQVLQCGNPGSAAIWGGGIAVCASQRAGQPWLAVQQAGTSGSSQVVEKRVAALPFGRLTCATAPPACGSANCIAR